METLSSFNAFNYESLYKNLPVVLGITEEESNELMSVDSVLARAGIVNGQRTFRTVEISETISEFLSGWRSGDIVDSMFDSITKPPYMELADFSLKPLQRDILLALLSQKDRSVNILLHGESGTGKTTLAVCLGQHLGVPVFGIRSENQQDPQQRMEQVALAATMFREQSVILVVDEADTLLAANPSYKGKGSIQKSYLNSFLESLSVKIIWISNDVTELPKSSVRRFDYILGFSGLPRAARINAWKKAIDANLETTCIDSAEIEQLADRWRLSPGAVTRSVHNLATMGTEAGPVTILNELLRGYEELLNEPSIPSVSPSSTPYHPLVLDVSGQLESSIDSARAFLANGSEGDSMSVLLHGPSGSGRPALPITWPNSWHGGSL